MADRDSTCYGIEQDDADHAWLQEFMGSSIPEGSVVKGFISVIAWIDPDGHERSRYYSCMDVTLTEAIGHLERAKFQIQYDVNEERKED